MTELSPIELDLPTLAALAGAAANEHLLARLREQGYAGVRTSYGYVIQNLIDQTPTVSELAIRLHVTQQAASKSVLEMEGLGLVSRIPDDTDSRIRRVTLTEQGRALLEAGQAARAELEGAVAADAGDLSDAKRVLVSLLAHTGALPAVTRRRARPPTD